MCDWKAEVGLNTLDQAVMDHEFCARVLQSAAVFDQLDVGELAYIEVLYRKMQMSDCRHRERIFKWAKAVTSCKSVSICTRAQERFAGCP